MDDLIKFMEYLDNASVLTDGIDKTVNNKIKEKNGWFPSILWETLGAKPLGNILTKKWGC